jgi:hypothetical protein
MKEPLESRQLVHEALTLLQNGSSLRVTNTPLSVKHEEQQQHEHDDGVVS